MVCAAPVPAQPLLVSLRLEDGRRHTLSLPHIDPAHAGALAAAAAAHDDARTALAGVLSTAALVRLVNALTGASGAPPPASAPREATVRSLASLLVGPSASDLAAHEFLVLLKLCGIAAEPEHAAHLLARAPRAALGSLSIHAVADVLCCADVQPALPLQTVAKLRSAFFEFDADRLGSLSPAQLAELTATLGLHWTAKDIMRVTGAAGVAPGKRSSKNAPMFPHGATPPPLPRADWMAFIDAVCDAYGDPFYALRYRYLFRVLDVESRGELRDEELLPLLRVCGLDDAASSAACGRLMGGRLGVSGDQFAAAMFEEEVTGADFPPRLLALATAFRNVDGDDAGELTKAKLLVIFRKMGVPLSISDRDALFKAMDTTGRGAASFRGFSSALATFDRSRVSPELGAAFSVAALAGASSYELTSTVGELEALRDTSARPALERVAGAVLASLSVTQAGALGDAKAAARRRVDSILEARRDEGGVTLTRPARARIFLSCWLCALRCLCYGVASGALNYVCQVYADSLFPVTGAEGTHEFASPRPWAHYILLYGPSVVLSIVEAAFIYYDLLRTSLSVAARAGVALWPPDPVRLFLANSLMAEALELGHPSYVRFGIDPMRGSSKAVLAVLGALYAARGGLTKFLLKIVLKRVVTRSAVKGALGLVSLPVVGFWNAVLAFSIMKNVRCVLLGRCAVPSVADALLGVHQELARQARRGSLRFLFRLFLFFVPRKLTPPPKHFCCTDRRPRAWISARPWSWPACGPTPSMRLPRRLTSPRCRTP